MHCSSVQLDDWKLVAAFNMSGGERADSGASASTSAATASSAPSGGQQLQGGSFSDNVGGGSGIVAVYDIRAVPSVAAARPSSAGGGSSVSMASAPWLQPVQMLQAPARINSVKVGIGTVAEGISRVCSYFGILI